MLISASVFQSASVAGQTAATIPALRQASNVVGNANSSFIQPQLMTDRKLFGTNTLVNDFVQRLTEVETIDGGWSTKYIDNETGLYWLKYSVDDRGFFQNLMLISPPPTTDELIEIAFTSDYLDEVSAAARRLCIEEQADKKEFRQKLTDRLNEVNLSRLEQRGKDRIKTIIQASELMDGVNKRDIVGKHFTEIQKDAAFFNSVSDNALRILSNL